jgi:hypothetical protein
MIKVIGLLYGEADCLLATKTDEADKATEATKATFGRLV